MKPNESTPEDTIPSELETFKCANCLETFDKEWTDEEASIEFSQRFEGGDICTAEIVCDDCYKQIMGD